MQTFKRANVLLTACIAIVLGYLVVGLFPFNFFPRNNVTWSRPGISFRSNAIAYSVRPVDLHEAASISLELYVEPGMQLPRKVPSMLSLYGGELPQSLVIGQRAQELMVRLPVCDERDDVRSQLIWVNLDLYPRIRRLITITSGVDGTAFYLDGIPARAYPKLILHSDELRGRLVMGNAPEGRNHWEGKLLGVAVFNRSLPAAEIARRFRLWTGKDRQPLAAAAGLVALYDFSAGGGRTLQDRSPSQNALAIPDSYHPLHKAVLVPPWRSRPYRRDIVTNIAGFVPFGFFFFIYRIQSMPGRTLRNALVTVAAAAMISLAIELLQVWLPSRSSSLTDLICNTGGALLAVLAVAATRYRLQVSGASDSA